MNRHVMRLAFAAIFLVMFFASIAPRAVLAAAFGIMPTSLASSEPPPLFTVSGRISLPEDAPAPSGGVTTSPLEVMTHADGSRQVPEPGSLILLGSGLFLFARLMRNRLK